MIKGLYPPFEVWGENTCWIISDTHFDDPDLIHPYPNRPSAIEQVKLINSKVGKNDTLIILGDIGNIEWVRQLRAKRKILICGNHDTGASNYQRHKNYEYFSTCTYDKKDAIKEMKKLYPNCQYEAQEFWTPTPFDEDCYWEICADNGLFDLIFTGPITIGEKLILSHEPIENCNWCFNIHGHTHDRNIVNDDYHFNVCADVINYIPINFNKWMKEGHLSKVKSLHRQTIDEATTRRRRRGYKLGGKHKC